MIVINTKHCEAFSGVSKSAAARIIGVSISTIHRWSKVKKVENYNYWVIYFQETRLKQRKGSKTIPKRNVYKQ